MGWVMTLLNKTMSTYAAIEGLFQSVRIKDGRNEILLEIYNIVGQDKRRYFRWNSGYKNDYDKDAARVTYFI